MQVLRGGVLGLGFQDLLNQGNRMSCVEELGCGQVAEAVIAEVVLVCISVRFTDESSRSTTGL